MAACLGYGSEQIPRLGKGVDRGLKRRGQNGSSVPLPGIRLVICPALAPALIELQTPCCACIRASTSRRDVNQPPSLRSEAPAKDSGTTPWRFAPLDKVAFAAIDTDPAINASHMGFFARERCTKTLQGQIWIRDTA
jgi:hypothetical protein